MLILLALIGGLILAVGMWGWIRQKNFNSYNCKEEKKPWDWKYRQACYDNEGIYWVLNSIGGILLGLTLLITLILGIVYSHTMIIDDKIAVYQEENTRIEEQVNIIVEKYQTYEKDTLKSCKIEDPTMIFAMYPDLKSDELISKQINLYVENNKQIKSLKTEKLDYRLMAWWIYFG